MTNVKKRDVTVITVRCKRERCLDYRARVVNPERMWKDEKKAESDQLGTPDEVRRVA